MAIPKPAPYIAEFEKLGFGMFVHWGLYALMGQGEWIQCIKGIPKEEYIKLFDQFTAEKFDAKELARTAASAGAKYIVLTTRHHDGFSLYDTKGLCDFDAPHSPAKRDLIKEFVDACREENIVPFFYHTTLDWYQDSFEHDFDGYLEYLKKSIEVLCTNYGKIGGFWFDGNWSKPEADWKEDELYSLIRHYQPEAMIINNTGLQARGAAGNSQIDSVTYENGTPEPMNREGMEKYVAGEMCLTINSHWGCGINDLSYKSPTELIETLCFCRKLGANFLLNIGPNGDGSIGNMEKALFELLGKWNSKYARAIYNGRPCDIKTVGKNFVLEGEEGNYYLFVHDIGITGDENVTLNSDNGQVICLQGLNRKVKSIKWLDADKELLFRQDKNSVSIAPSGFSYGSNYIVRVAEILCEE